MAKPRTPSRPRSSGSSRSSSRKRGKAEDEPQDDEQQEEDEQPKARRGRPRPKPKPEGKAKAEAEEKPKRRTRRRTKAADPEPEPEPEPEVDDEDEDEDDPPFDDDQDEDEDEYDDDDQDDDEDDDEDEVTDLVPTDNLRPGDFGYKGDKSVARPEDVTPSREVPEGADDFKSYVRLRFPSGRQDAWQWPVGDGEYEDVEEFEGVIVAVSFPRGLPGEPYDAKNPKAPVCSSRDGLIGRSDPKQQERAEELDIVGTHDCGSCRYAAFHGHEGHKCRPRATCWVMLAGEEEPIAVPVPTTSLKVLRSYRKMMGGYEGLWTGVTVFGTEADDDGQNSLVVLEMNESVALDSETLNTLKELREEVIEELEIEGVLADLMHQTEKPRTRKAANW